MAWWQVLLIFAGIPSAVFITITVLVLILAEGRTPDGLATAAGAGDPEGGAGQSACAAEKLGSEQPDDHLGE